MLDKRKQIEANCPECGTTLEEVVEGTTVYCPNPTCEWENDAPGVPPNEHNTDPD